MSKGLKKKYPGWGFGEGRLYWPSPRLTADERAVGWKPCEDWRTCKDVPSGFVPGFEHSHKESAK